MTPSELCPVLSPSLECAQRAGTCFSHAAHSEVMARRSHEWLHCMALSGQSYSNHAEKDCPADFEEAAAKVGNAHGEGHVAGDCDSLQKPRSSVTRLHLAEQRVRPEEGPKPQRSPALANAVSAAWETQSRGHS